jgi:hypothetical protein
MREKARVGLSIVNDTDQTNTYTVTAADSAGNVIGTKTLTINARTNTIGFIDEMMTLPADYYGPVVVTSNSGTASVIGLRFTGTVFTTIPETIRPN